MRLAVFLIVLQMSAALAWAGSPADVPPDDVLKFFRGTAESLAERDARLFLDNFDQSMPGYAKLQAEIEGLLAGHEVGSTIEIVSDDGDDQKRILELDWLLLISDAGQRRQIVKCQIAKQGKRWKITALEPIEFFRYE